MAQITTLAAAGIFLASSLVGCKDDELKGAQADVQKTNINLDLPQVPEFDMPSSDGEHRTPRELRLKGRTLFDTDIQVKGFVTWIYDCRKAEKKPEMTDKELDKLLEDEPDRCLRPHFYLGDEKNTLPERSIWVVELPRAFRKDEEDGYEKEQIKEQLELEARAHVEVGDEVIVKGEWKITSPRGFANSDGLLVFKELENLTTPYEEDPKKK